MALAKTLVISTKKMKKPSKPSKDKELVYPITLRKVYPIAISTCLLIIVKTAKDLESYFSKYKTFEDDPELSFAMLLSMKVFLNITAPAIDRFSISKEAFTMKPEPGPDNMTLNFRLPNGKSVNFVFPNTTLIDVKYRLS